MTDKDTGPIAEREMLRAARKQGTGATIRTFVRLSGPGWLQSAITLGGGSLAGSLYLGVLGGFSLLWLQPLMMLFGVVMLGAISYVTLSTGERPFGAIKRHINPVLAWGWVIATFMANIVWCLPQFALGTAALQQNLIPSLDGTAGKFICCALLLIAAGTVVWFYDTGSRGIRIFEIILKIMVGIVVISFFGVVVKMSMQDDGLDWGVILSGLIPDLTLLDRPADTFTSALAATGAYSEYWSDLIVGQQRDVMITAAATAVGINMTFLLPYSLLRRGWDKEFRGLALFDLSTGLFIPFFLATSCVVIAGASRFHTQPQPGVIDGTAPAGLVRQYEDLLRGRVMAEAKAGEVEGEAVQLSVAEQTTRMAGLSEGDKQMAAMLVKRDAFVLAQSLEALTGKKFANYVFGIGVLGMALSTIIILMLISGFTVCEIFNVPPTGWWHRLGCLPPALGVLGPFVWSGKTQFWLAVPTSIFGMILLPIAYLTFFLMMNNRQLMGEGQPKGRARWIWNGLMAVGVGLAAGGSAWSILTREATVRFWVLVMVGLFVLAALVAHFRRTPPREG